MVKKLDLTPVHTDWTNYVAWNLNLWVMRAYRQWQQYTPPNHSYTAEAAQIVARDILGQETADGVDLDDPAINWEEIAKVWNED
jgi:hypothetical protein